MGDAFQVALACDVKYNKKEYMLFSFLFVFMHFSSSFIGQQWTRLNELLTILTSKKQKGFGLDPASLDYDDDVSAIGRIEPRTNSACDRAISKKISITQLILKDTWHLAVKLAYYVVLC